MANACSGGIPTDVDVANLFKRFGTPAENSLIAYVDIADVIKVAVGSNRFRTVVSRWRRQLAGQPHNVYLRAQPDERSYRVMDPSLRLAKGRQHDRSARRHYRRGYVLIGSTDADRLTSEEKQEHTHLHHKFATQLQSDRVLAKRPVPQLSETNVTR